MASNNNEDDARILGDDLSFMDEFFQESTSWETVKPLADRTLLLLCFDEPGPTEAASAAQAIHSAILSTPFSTRKTPGFLYKLKSNMMVLNEYNRLIYQQRNAFPYSEELMEVLKLYVKVEHDCLYSTLALKSRTKEYIKEQERLSRISIYVTLKTMLPSKSDKNKDGQQPYNVKLTCNESIFQILKNVGEHILKRRQKIVFKLIETIAQRLGLDKVADSVFENGEADLNSIWRNRDLNVLTESGIDSRLQTMIPEDEEECRKLFCTSDEIDDTSAKNEDNSTLSFEELLEKACAEIDENSSKFRDIANQDIDSDNDIVEVLEILHQPTDINTRKRKTNESESATVEPSTARGELESKRSKKDTQVMPMSTASLESVDLDTSTDKNVPFAIHQEDQSQAKTSTDEIVPSAIHQEDQAQTKTSTDEIVPSAIHREDQSQATTSTNEIVPSAIHQEDQSQAKTSTNVVLTDDNVLDLDISSVKIVATAIDQESVQDSMTQSDSSKISSDMVLGDNQVIDLNRSFESIVSPTINQVSAGVDDESTVPPIILQESCIADDQSQAEPSSNIILIEDIQVIDLNSCFESIVTPAINQESAQVDDQSTVPSTIRQESAEVDVRSPAEPSSSNNTLIEDKQVIELNSSIVSIIPPTIHLEPVCFEAIPERDVSSNDKVIDVSNEVDDLASSGDSIFKSPIQQEATFEDLSHVKQSTKLSSFDDVLVDESTSDNTQVADSKDNDPNSHRLDAIHQIELTHNQAEVTLSFKSTSLPNDCNPAQNSEDKGPDSHVLDTIHQEKVALDNQGQLIRSANANTQLVSLESKSSDTFLLGTINQETVLEHPNTDVTTTDDLNTSKDNHEHALSVIGDVTLQQNLMPKSANDITIGDFEALSEMLSDEDFHCDDEQCQSNKHTELKDNALHQVLSKDTNSNLMVYDMDDAVQNNLSKSDKDSNISRKDKAKELSGNSQLEESSIADKCDELVSTEVEDINGTNVQNEPNKSGSTQKELLEIVENSSKDVAESHVFQEIVEDKQSEKQMDISEDQVLIIPQNVDDSNIVLKENLEIAEVQLSNVPETAELNEVVIDQMEAMDQLPNPQGNVESITNSDEKITPITPQQSSKINSDEFSENSQSQVLPEFIKILTGEISAQLESKVRNTTEETASENNHALAISKSDNIHEELNEIPVEEMTNQNGEIQVNFESQFDHKDNKISGEALKSSNNQVLTSSESTKQIPTEEIAAQNIEIQANLESQFQHADTISPEFISENSHVLASSESEASKEIQHERNNVPTEEMVAQNNEVQITLHSQSGPNILQSDIPAGLNKELMHPIREIETNLDAHIQPTCDELSTPKEPVQTIAASEVTTLFNKEMPVPYRDLEAQIHPECLIQTPSPNEQLEAIKASVIPPQSTAQELITEVSRPVIDSLRKEDFSETFVPEEFVAILDDVTQSQIDEDLIKDILQPDNDSWGDDRNRPEFYLTQSRPFLEGIIDLEKIFDDINTLPMFDQTASVNLTSPLKEVLTIPSESPEQEVRNVTKDPLICGSYRTKAVQNLSLRQTESVFEKILDVETTETLLRAKSLPNVEVSLVESSRTEPISQASKLYIIPLNTENIAEIQSTSKSPPKARRLKAQTSPTSSPNLRKVPYVGKGKTSETNTASAKIASTISVMPSKDAISQSSPKSKSPMFKIPSSEVSSSISATYSNTAISNPSPKSRSLITEVPTDLSAVTLQKPSTSTWSPKIGTLKYPMQPLNQPQPPRLLVDPDQSSAGHVFDLSIPTNASTRSDGPIITGSNPPKRTIQSNTNPNHSTSEGLSPPKRPTRSLPNNRSPKMSTASIGFPNSPETSFESSSHNVQHAVVENSLNGGSGDSEVQEVQSCSSSNINVEAPLPMQCKKPMDQSSLKEKEKKKKSLSTVTQELYQSAMKQQNPSDSADPSIMSLFVQSEEDENSVTWGDCNNKIEYYLDRTRKQE